MMRCPFAPALLTPLLLLFTLAVPTPTALADPAEAVHTVTPRDYELPDGHGLDTGLGEDDGSPYLRLTGTTDNAVAIALGPWRVEANQSYEVSYRLRGVEQDKAARVYLLVREHEATDGRSRPLKPYHKQSVRDRAVPIDPQQPWLERGVRLTTGADTRALTASLVILELDGTLDLGTLKVHRGEQIEAARAAQAEEDYDALLASIRQQADQRERVVPRTLVFSRSQMKYGLERQYYHKWNDRPLLVNRAYRVPFDGITPLPSYRKILEQVRRYDIDGLAFFPETKDRMSVFELHEQAGVEGVQLLPEFLPFDGPEAVKNKVAIVRRALASPHTPRIDGKLLITSYHAEGLSPREWDAILDQVRDEVGDTFMFLPTLVNVVKLRGPFNAGEPISRAEFAAEQQYLRDYLEVSDGIYFNYPAAFRQRDRTFDEAFYRELFIPVFKSVLAEPAYRDKLLGLSAYRSHMAPDRGNSLHEDATRTLRHSFEAAMDAEPDVLILPEWDEFNENTCWRPTISGSFTSQRIVRYYMSQIRDIAPTPVPGDDPSVPNLVMSNRKFAILGEQVVFELLHVPDAATPQPYRARLTLHDERGDVVHRFEPVAFDGDRLQEQRYAVATEDFADARALRPVVTVLGYRGRPERVYDGFQATQLRATWNWDDLFIKQPLRDLYEPDKAELAWSRDEDSALQLAGHVVGDEPLALVEVVADDRVVFAVDPDDEFDRNDPGRVRLKIDYRAMHPTPIRGHFRLEGASGEWFDHGSILHQPRHQAEFRADGVLFNGTASTHDRWVYVTLPRADIDAATLRITLGAHEVALPVREVIEQQMVGRALPGGLHVTVYPYHHQLDIPTHLNQRQASFTTRVRPGLGTEQYHLRVTTVDGHTYRSAPRLVPGSASEQTQAIRVYSDRRQGPVDLAVAADRVPTIDYDFAPGRGAVLLSEAGRPFWAGLGGFTRSTTGQGVLNGLYRRNYPEDVDRSAPRWVTGDGDETQLVFNGAGTFLELPRDTLPRRAAYTLAFEINPARGDDMVLLENRTLNRPRGLVLSIEDGRLLATYNVLDWSVKRIETSLKVPAGEWSAVQVEHDLDQLTLTVNGERQAFPLDQPAENVAFTVIGHAVTGPSFAGKLRGLSITHGR